MEHVVVVVPVDPDVDEAQQVGQEAGRRVGEVGQPRAVGDVELEHHDRDDDREDAVAERLEPAGPHASMISGCARRDSNSHWSGPKPDASTYWATGARGSGGVEPQVLAQLGDVTGGLDVDRK